MTLPRNHTIGEGARTNELHRERISTKKKEKKKKMDDSLKMLGIYLLNTDIVPLTSIHPPLDFLTVCAFS